jgi:hypothetical protein
MLGDLIANKVLNSLGGTGTDDINPLYGAQQVDPDEYHKQVVNNFVQEYNDSKPDYAAIKDPNAAEVEFQNAYPGYKKPTKSIWLDTDGNDVSDQINAMNPKQRHVALNTGYKDPGFFKRLTSTGEQEAAFNREALGVPGQSSQTRNVLRANTGSDISTIPVEQRPFGNDLQANITGTINPRLFPSYLNPEVQARQFATMGGNAVTSQAALTDTHNQLIGNTALQKSGNLWREQLDKAGELQYDIGRNEALLGALPDTQAAIRNQAANEASTTGQQRKEMPVTLGSMAGEGAQRNLAANYFPDSLVGTPYVDRYIPGKGIQTSGGNLYSGYRSPKWTEMQAFSRGMPTGETPTPTSTGQAYIKSNVGGNIIPATIGDTGQQQPSKGPDWLNNSNADMITLAKYPEVTIDKNSGRAYTKDGHLMGNLNNNNDPTLEPIKQAAIQQLQEESQDNKDSVHDAAQATIARKLAELKEQQKHLQAAHNHSGWLPAQWQNMKRNSTDIGNEPDWIGAPLGKLTSDWHPTRNYIKPAYNNLIGE